MMGVEELDVRDLLIRIDERVKAVQEDIREINKMRKCSTHAEKLKTLERTVWGCIAIVGTLSIRILYETFK